MTLKPAGSELAESKLPGSRSRKQPSSHPAGRRGRGSFWTHFILIVAVFLVASPLLFALVKATQTGAQVTGPGSLGTVSAVSRADATAPTGGPAG